MVQVFILMKKGSGSTSVVCKEDDPFDGWVAVHAGRAQASLHGHQFGFVVSHLTGVFTAFLNEEAFAYHRPASAALLRGAGDQAGSCVQLHW